MAERIPDAEIVFDPHSFRDVAGRVFRWQGSVYRAIRKSHGPLFARLFEDGTLQSLVERGLLIDTERTAYELDGYELVVRHRTLPYVSYPTEWCAAMLRDAALLTLDLVDALAEVGLTLRDSHPWNILFDGPRPHHVDLTSITSMEPEGTWLGYSSFCRGFFHSLVLMTKGRDDWARRLMNTDRGTWRRDVISLAPSTAPSMLADALRSQLTSLVRRGRSGGRKAIARQLDRLRSRIRSLRIESGDDADDASASERGVFEQAVGRLGPSSILCIGSSPSAYAQLSARACARVVAFDSRSEPSTRLYQEARTQDLHILPLVMDFEKPTPEYGLFSHHFVAATARFACDLVVAPRVSRLLERGNRRLDCGGILDGISLYGKRWVFLGYVPPGPATEGSDDRERSLYDTLENFVRLVRPRFQSVEVIPFNESNGALLVCEK